jgi:hypothetical protein
MPWDAVWQQLSRQFSEDVVQETMARYLGQHREIKHPINYFRVMAKRIKWEIQREALLCETFHKPDLQEPPAGGIGLPPQLARVLLAEVWNLLPDTLRQDLIGRTNTVAPQSNASRVRRCRAKRKLDKLGLDQ